MFLRILFFFLNEDYQKFNPFSRHEGLLTTEECRLSRSFFFYSDKLISIQFPLDCIIFDRLNSVTTHTWLSCYFSRRNWIERLLWKSHISQSLFRCGFVLGLSLRWDGFLNSVSKRPQNDNEHWSRNGRTVEMRKLAFLIKKSCSAFIRRYIIVWRRNLSQSANHRKSDVRLFANAI